MHDFHFDSGTQCLELRQKFQSFIRTEHEGYLVNTKNYFNDFRPLILNNKVQFFYDKLEKERELDRKVEVISRRRLWCPRFCKKDEHCLQAPKIDFDDCDIAKYMYRIVNLYP